MYWLNFEGVFKARDRGAMKQDTKNILLVEDHDSFRQALALVFEQEPDFRVAAQAGSLAEARSKLEGVEMAILDLGLPDGDGVELIGDLVSASPRVTTLVLSASLDRIQYGQALEAGAAGVLHKSASIKEIVGAARRLLAGETLLSQNEIVEMLRLANRKRDAERETQIAIDKLTEREKDVLRALAEGLTSKEIATKLHITVETERTHMVNIFNKLSVHSRLQALVFAARHGVVELR